MFRILIAPDSFKDALSAKLVARHLHLGLSHVLPNAIYDLAPVADGGEGFLEATVEGTKGYYRNIMVHDALMRPCWTEIGFTPDGQTAFIEMARINGIEKLSTQERTPLLTSTFGTGEAIRFAARQGCRKIILGLGGSATNDGGAGMAQALGFILSDKLGKPILPGGGNLLTIENIASKENFEPLPEIIAACDVDNPFTGINGASFVYGPQKGASPQEVELLDKNLNHLANIIRQKLKIDIKDIPGSGAAGGLAGGLLAFAGARLVNGFQLVSHTIQLEDRIKEANLIITGEGRLDKQTLNGKAPYGVAQLAKKYGKPTIGIAGTLGEEHELLYPYGFNLLLSLMNKPMPLTEAIEQTDLLLETAGRQIGHIITLSTVIQGYN